MVVPPADCCKTTSSGSSPNVLTYTRGVCGRDLNLPACCRGDMLSDSTVGECMVSKAPMLINIAAKYYNKQS